MESHPSPCRPGSRRRRNNQRGRPSGVMRLDLLKVVGSSPAFLARPEGESPARAARRSSAVQIWAWVSMGVVPVHRIATDFVQHVGIIACEPQGPAFFEVLHMTF